MDILRRTALFWDYENVPLRRKDRGRFLWAIVNMINAFTPDFIRIYGRKTTISLHDYNQLLTKGFDKNKHFKWISSNVPNAVDFSLIRSCIDVLNKRPEITQVVLISGDGDFLPLVTQYPDHYIVVICQLKNLNKKLIKTVNRAYSVEALITKTKKWFYV
jgi:hypothetical protein